MNVASNNQSRLDHVSSDNSNSQLGNSNKDEVNSNVSGNISNNVNHNNNTNQKKQ